MQKDGLKISLVLAAALLLSTSFPCRAEMPKIYDFGFKEGLKSINLNWQRTALSETESFVLIKKESVCPKSSRDGKEIYRGSGTEYVDKNIQKGKKYCYGLYVNDISGRTSEIKITGLAEKSNWIKYLATILLEENNYFIALEIIAFLILVWINLKKRGYFEKESRLKVIRVDED